MVPLLPVQASVLAAAAAFMHQRAEAIPFQSLQVPPDCILQVALYRHIYAIIDKLAHSLIPITSLEKLQLVYLRH